MVRLKHILCEGTEDHRVKRLAELVAIGTKRIVETLTMVTFSSIPARNVVNIAFSHSYEKSGGYLSTRTTTPASFIFGHPKSWT